MKNYLALDLGAESGRAMLGTFENGKLSLSEEHRFLTGPESVPTMYPDTVPAKLENDCSLLWDFVRFWHEIKKAISQTARKTKIEAIGVDTWGVDFALLDKNGMLISQPYHYRDYRTKGMLEEAFKRMPKEQIYELTGIQFMSLNSLYQLLSMSAHNSPLLKIADKLLMVPDLLNYWLTGRAVAEFTEATTTQFFDPRKMNWCDEIISAMGFPKHIFPDIVPPGTVLGPLRPSLIQELGLETIVVAPPTHDTGAAVSAVPAESKDFIWISSGTWSIVGMNVPEPIINDKSFQYNFTNEGGLGGTFRFSKNVMGLWIVQQCRLQWMDEGKEFSYSELTQMAKQSPLLKSFINPDCVDFLRPGRMVYAVQQYCQKTHQPLPQSEGEVIRAVLEGLALRYRYIIEQLEEFSGKKMTTIHIVGGGTQNHLLSQFTADALGRPVVTGPIEATAIGNIMVQAIAKGDIRNWQEGVQVIRDSFEILTFEPRDKKPWDQAYDNFKTHIDQIDQIY